MIRHTVKIKRIRILAGLLTLAGIAWFSTPAFSEDSQSNEDSYARPWAKTASPAEIIEKIRDDERWIWDVDSILIRAESILQKRPEGIEASRAALKKQSPDLDWDDPNTRKRFPDLMPELRGSLLLAWDKKRVAAFEDKKDVSLDHRVYDGNRTLVHHHAFMRAQEHYAIFNDPEPVGATALGFFAVGRITRPSPWWIEGDKNSREEIEPGPESYQDMGMKERDGGCYRVLKQSRGGSRELWIEGETGRLTYVKSYARFAPPREVVEKFKALEPALLRVHMAIMADLLLQLDSESFSPLSDLDAALQQRPDWPDREITDDFMKKIRIAAGQPLPDDRDQAGSIQLEYAKIFVLESLEILDKGDLIDVDLNVLDSAVERGVSQTPDLIDRLAERSMRKLTQGYPELAALHEEQPFVEYAFKDWRETTPGKPLPFVQGCTRWIAGREGTGKVDFIQSIQITELLVNEPLPDALFVMKIEEGIEVIDRTHDPMLIYKHKDEFTDEEWNVVLDEANERARRVTEWESSYQGMIGKPAPPLTVDSWLNGGPLLLDDLKGKLVVLDFFADWCTPCRNAYPHLARYHQNHAGDDLVVIGVHTRGADIESVKSLLKDFRMQYPIAIDSPSDEPGARGKTFTAYHIQSIPHAVLIDGNGIIVTHGEVNEVLSEASRRIGEAKH